MRCLAAIVLLGLCALVWCQEETADATEASALASDYWNGNNNGGNNNIGGNNNYNRACWNVRCSQGYQCQVENYQPYCVRTNVNCQSLTGGGGIFGDSASDDAAAQTEKRQMSGGRATCYSYQDCMDYGSGGSYGRTKSCCPLNSWNQNGPKYCFDHPRYRPSTNNNGGWPGNGR